jgi:predicted ferric reductase
LEVDLENSSTSYILAAIAIVIGLILSGILMPILLPGLVTSISGSEPKVFWYLSRSSAIISYLFLWGSMVFGLLLSSRTAKIWPGGFTANDLHQFVSIAGLSAGLFHGLILMGDKYMNISLIQVLIPFASSNYRPEWVGIGQLVFYLWAGVLLSFYIRKQIGTKTWKVIHYISFLVFAGALIHGVTSGSDSSSLWMSILYWVTGASVLFLTFYRIFSTSQPTISKRAEARAK